MKRLHLFLLYLISSILCLSHTAYAEITLKFGTYATDKPTDVIRQFRPALDYIETRASQLLNEPVHISMSVSSTYEGAIRKLAHSKTDFARFGAVSYVKAKEIDPGVSILALESKNGLPFFNGVICVNSESNLTTVSQLKMKSFAFGNPLSTIGRYLSQQILYSNGIKAKQLAFFDYLQRHDKVGIAVAMKQYDAGALKEKTYKSLIKKGYPLKVLYTFKVMNKPWIANSKLDPKLKRVLHRVIIEMSSDFDVMSSLGTKGFIMAANKDFDSIRASLKENYLFFK